MIFSFDLSERCTGATCFSLSGELLDFCVVANGELHDEELFIWNVTKLITFINNNWNSDEPVGFVTEALALHAKSQTKDKLFGQFWYFQCVLKEEYYWVPRGKICVSEWRASVLSKKEQREAKQVKVKDPLKVACYNKLPEDVKQRFEEYLEEHKEEINLAKGLKPESKSKRYLEARLDLSDSYWLGKYRLSLEDK